VGPEDRQFPEFREILARKGSGADYWLETRRQNGDLFRGTGFAGDQGGCR
jgi:hypothetical protein